MSESNENEKPRQGTSVSDAWRDVLKYRAEWRESQHQAKAERRDAKRQTKIDAFQEETLPQRIFGEIHVSLDALLIGFGCGAGIWFNDYRRYHGGQGDGVESGEGMDDWYRQDKKMQGKEMEGLGFRYGQNGVRVEFDKGDDWQDSPLDIFGAMVTRDDNLFEEKINKVAKSRDRAASEMMDYLIQQKPEGLDLRYDRANRAVACTDREQLNQYLKDALVKLHKEPFFINNTKQHEEGKSTRAFLDWKREEHYFDKLDSDVKNGNHLHGRHARDYEDWKARTSKQLPGPDKGR